MDEETKLRKAVEALARTENDISNRTYNFMLALDNWVDAKVETAITEHKRAEEERAYYARCGEDM